MFAKWGPAEIFLARSGSKQFDTDPGIPERIFEKVDFGKNQQTAIILKKLPSLQELTRSPLDKSFAL